MKKCERQTSVSHFFVRIRDGSFRGRLSKMSTEGTVPNADKSDGGHVWANWRLYLNTFAPLLFK